MSRKSSTMRGLPCSWLRTRCNSATSWISIRPVKVKTTNSASDDLSILNVTAAFFANGGCKANANTKSLKQIEFGMKQIFEISEISENPESIAKRSEKLDRLSFEVLLVNFQRPDLGVQG
jgi:hypothetical protein